MFEGLSIQLLACRSIYTTDLHSHFRCKIDSQDGLQTVCMEHGPWPHYHMSQGLLVSDFWGLFWPGRNGRRTFAIGFWNLCNSAQCTQGLQEEGGQQILTFLSQPQQLPWPTHATCNAGPALDWSGFHNP